MTTVLAKTERVTALRIAKQTNPCLAYLASLPSPASRRTLLHALNVIADIVSGGEHTAETLPWDSLNRAHADAIRAALNKRYAKRTTNLFLCALRGVSQKCWELGYISVEARDRLKGVKSIKGGSANGQAGRSLDFREAKALFKVCAEDRTATGRRDAALVGVLWCCGLRRAELTTLQLADATENGDAIRLHVCGKGDKERAAFVTGGAADALREWLAVRGDHPGPLFLATKQGGEVLDHGLTTQAVYKRLRTLGKRASVSAFSPHDLRRTFVGDMIDAGADLSVVQRLCGHESVETTQRYDRRPERVEQAAMQRRKTPFVEPVGS